MDQQQNAISLARVTSLDGKVSSYEPCQTPTLSVESNQKVESNLTSTFYLMFYPTSNLMLDPMLISCNYSMLYPILENKNRSNLNNQEGIGLTGPFHLDRATLFCQCARLAEQGVLVRRRNRQGVKGGSPFQ